MTGLGTLLVRWCIEAWVRARVWLTLQLVDTRELAPRPSAYCSLWRVNAWREHNAVCVVQIYRSGAWMGGGRSRVAYWAYRQARVQVRGELVKRGLRRVR